MFSRVSLSIALLGLAGPPTAFSQDWDWKLTPYLWASGIEGDIGLGGLQGPVDADFSDILDVLSGSALIHVEAQRDRHGIFGDLVYMNLEPDDISTPGGAAEVGLEAISLEFGYVRSLERLGLEFGVRYWDYELSINPASGAERKRDQDWVDGFVGVRMEHEISSDWTLAPRFNIGAGGSDLVWGLELNLSREFNNGNRIVVGGKIIDFDYEEPNAGGIPFLMDVTFAGLLVGYTFD